MDFLDRLIDYIELNLDVSIKVGRLDRSTASIAIRPTPSSISGRFMDQGKIREYSFQILTKNPNQQAAASKLEDMASLLEGLDGKEVKSNNNSFKLIKCEVYTLPNFVEVTDHDEYIYTALFTAELQGGI